MNSAAVMWMCENLCGVLTWSALDKDAGALWLCHMEDTVSFWSFMGSLAFGKVTSFSVPSVPEH